MKLNGNQKEAIDKVAERAFKEFASIQNGIADEELDDEDYNAQVNSMAVCLVISLIDRLYCGGYDSYYLRNIDSEPDYQDIW